MIPKIVSKEQKEKKRSRIQVIFALAVILILAASYISYASLSSDSKTEKYNGKRFTLTDNGWQGSGLSFATRYLPSEVENISMTGAPQQDSFNTKVYLVAPTSRSAALELLRALPIQSLQEACLPEQADMELCADLPLKSCDDASQQNAIIIFREENETSARYSRSCLEIAGSDEDAMTLAVDKALYSMYGIIRSQ